MRRPCRNEQKVRENLSTPALLPAVACAVLAYLAFTYILTQPYRQDWACEACFAIYPLFPAILQYTIETLILDANILRDSILVRLEMVHPNPDPKPEITVHPTLSATLNLTLPLLGSV